MKEKIKIKLRENWFAYLLIFFAVAFNFYTLYPELSVKIDPNDNIYQFSLIYRFNDVLEKVLKGQLSPLNLLDHWVPYWASGYPLPYYYQHFPHFLVVLIYHLIFKSVSLYGVFNLVKFLLWVFWPISIYLGCRKLKFSSLAAAVSALLGSQIITDGLYGADISSFAWRGYGLTTQLFALFFAPLALGQIYQVLENQNNEKATKTGSKQKIMAVILLAATFASHMAIGYIIALSSFFFLFSYVNPQGFNFKTFFKKSVWPLFQVLLLTFLLLSYWLVPMLLGNVYHNISFWDPPVKWNSYGATGVITQFLDGQLFDFNRPPVLTFLVVIGFLICLFFFEGQYRFLALLFPFWFLVFFGRTTWGSLIEILPMMKEMHQQRLINALHLASLPLIGLSAELLQRKIKKKIFWISLLAFLAYLVYPANYHYLKLNTGWLGQANVLYEKDEMNFNKLITKLRQLPPGRIYPGRPGNWGREFKIGATQMYLALSVHGFDINGFLPESWSLNTDLETFFNEYRPEDYQIYNVRYLITPANFELPDFARLIEVFGPYKLAEIETTGYFDIITSNLLVKGGKEDIANIHHLWLNSDLPGKKEYPSLDLTNKLPKHQYAAEITLENTNLYQRDGKINTLYSLAYPLTESPQKLSQVLSENITAEIYQSTIQKDEKCANCLAVFKMTYHPNWQVKVDNQVTEKIMIFPSFMAIEIPAGTHTITFQYIPDRSKLLFLVFGVTVLALLIRQKTF